MKHKVGIQGGEASYHEAAARQLYPESTIVYYETFTTLFGAARKGQVDLALAAICNNRSQFIPETYSLLTEDGHDLTIAGETYLRVEHALLAPKGASMASITEVHSQAPALEQCRQFLELHLPEAHLVEEHDTAGSAKLTSELDDMTKAAIASRRAGELYGLETLHTSIQDDPDNITRFLVLQSAKNHVALENADKTTMLLKTPQIAGSLVGALLPFKEAGINLSNLHSRIIPNSAFNMVFFVEYEAGIPEPRTKKVLKQLFAEGYTATILGSYKSAAIPIAEKNGTAPRKVLS